MLKFHCTDNKTDKAAFSLYQNTYNKKNKNTNQTLWNT